MLAELLRSRYLTYHGLRDCGIETGKAALVTAILHGDEPIDDDDPAEWACRADDEWHPAPRPFEPDDADWQDYIAWSDRVEAMQALRDEDEEADQVEAIGRFLAWREDTRRS